MTGRVLTRKGAVALAKARWGSDAAVKIEKDGARIGFHGEYVRTSFIGSIPGMPDSIGHYRCAQCSSFTTTPDGVVESRVWHRAGGWQARYVVGFIALGMFFEVKGEGESFEAALEDADRRRKR